MEGIEFDTEKYKPNIIASQPKKKSWAINLVMKLSGGRIKNDAQASVVLAFIAAIFVIISIINFASSGSKSKAPSQEEIMRMQNLMDQQLNSNQTSN